VRNGKPVAPTTFALDTVTLFRRYRFMIGPRGKWGWRACAGVEGRWHPVDVVWVARAYVVNFVEMLIHDKAPGVPKRQRRRAAKLALAAIEEKIKSLPAEPPEHQEPVKHRV
jgi:hypothetical protein